MKTITIDLEHWYAKGNYHCIDDSCMSDFCTGSFTNAYQPLLKNKRDCKCCLGFACESLAPHLEIYDVAQPSQLDETVERLSYLFGESLEDSGLAQEAMQINDANKIKIYHKMVLLEELFRKEGLRLRFTRHNWIVI